MLKPESARVIGPVHGRPMPSLKDMRNRIASVKATRKITKAMQMVAAAKLRRAQEAATAARPYAERMDAVLANLAAARQQGGRLAASGRHRQGRRASAGRHDRRAWTVRRFQLAISPASRVSMPTACCATARPSRSCASAARAPTICAAISAGKIVDRVDLRGVRQLGFANAEDIGDKVAGDVRRRRVRCGDDLLLRVQVT